jgi:DNA-binding transcriptional regulator YiaG
MTELNDRGSDLSPSACPCPRCNSTEIEERWVDEPFLYGEGHGALELHATIPVLQCRSCSFSYTDARTEDLQHEAACKHFGLLTPADIKALRDRHRLSRAEFAVLTRLGDATIARWERGELFQNAAYDRYLRLLQNDMNMRQLRSMGQSSTTDDQAQAPRRAQEAGEPAFRGLGTRRTVVEGQARRFRLRLSA